MYALFSVLLALGSGLPSPAQQQRSATVVYRVYYAVIATGSFTTVIDDETSITQNVHDRLATVGTAFAVDQDGWLLTARHVVDAQGHAREFCRVVEQSYTRYRVDSVQLDMTLIDIVGHVWPAQIVVTPPKGSRDDVCHSSGPLQVERQSFWPVSVEKMDDVADLALIKLTQQDGPILALPFGTMVGLDQWHPVYAFGFPKGFVMRKGLLVRPCEKRIVSTSDAPDIGPDVVRASTELLSRYYLEGEPGMSGGPIIAGGALVGITVSAGSTEADPWQGIASIPLTFAVPVDYVHAWYRWARGLSKDKPTEVCSPKP